MTPSSSKNSVSIILGCAVLVLLLSMGVRATFGLFMQPMGLTRGFDRETFSLAFAIQNIVWGIGSILFGMLADKYGSAKAVILGALFYALGIASMSTAHSPLMLYLTAGLLVGLGQSGTTFGVILGVVGRAVAPEQRSVALGIASAGGSLGQFVMVPLGQTFIVNVEWPQALLLLALMIILIVPLTVSLTGKPQPQVAQEKQSLAQALNEAIGHRSFLFLFASFLVCGFHTAFITLHLPAYVTDMGLTLKEGAMAVALIGLFNVFGSYLCGWLGGRMSKKKLLAAVYMLRGMMIVLLLLFPLTPMVLYLFAAAMGLLWLGTVPLTNGLIGQIYGVRYVSTLYGVIFLGHQIGSFIGVWLGGKVFVLTGSYNIVWYLGIVLALMAAIMSWPIDERPILRKAVAAS